jgi:hypothetical protein
MSLLVCKYHKNTPFGKYIQLRWKEPLGRPECPYLYRWTLVLFGYTIRLHHWIRSDDNRFFHDHACNLISIILKGWYYNVIPLNDTDLDTKKGIKIKARAWHPWYANAKNKHYLEIPEGGAWTLLLQGKPYHKWGFYVNNHKWRPLRYFSKYGIIQDDKYTGKE